MVLDAPAVGLGLGTPEYDVAIAGRLYLGSGWVS
jgi:hypothetical protein